MLTKLETLVPPVVWAALAGGGMLVLNKIVGERALPESIRLPLGLVAVAIGVGVALAGVVGFGQAKTSVDPHTISKASSLVTSGVYTFTRNPMYLGMLFVVAGFGLWRGGLLSTFMMSAAFVAVLTRLQIIPEERMLAEKFGDEYRTFVSSVRRWI